MARVMPSVEAGTILGDTPPSLQGRLLRCVTGGPAAMGRSAMASTPGRRRPGGVGLSMVPGRAHQEADEVEDRMRL